MATVDTSMAALLGIGAGIDGMALEFSASHVARVASRLPYPLTQDQIRALVIASSEYGIYPEGGKVTSGVTEKTADGLFALDLLVTNWLDGNYLISLDGEVALSLPHNKDRAATMRRAGVRT